MSFTKGWTFQIINFIISQKIEKKREKYHKWNNSRKKQKARKTKIQ